VVPLSRLADADIAQLLAGLVADSLPAARELEAGRLDWQFQAEARYRGQAHEVAVHLPARGPMVCRLAGSFHRLHQRQFGFSNPHAEVELVNIRAIAVAARQKPRFPHLPARRSPRPQGAGGRVFAGSRWLDALYVEREELAPGDRGDGPLVIEETTATCYVPLGWHYTIHAAGHIELARA
jgi:N-methylhydantoinase A/oxoprolinase/acetone carboxylase beta subunit